MLRIEICEVKGFCPVHEVGYRMLIDGAKILLKETDSLRVHVLSSLLHYVVALDEGVNLIKLGLTKPENSEYMYIQRLDPWKPHIDSRTVVFGCRRGEGGSS